MDDNMVSTSDMYIAALLLAKDYPLMDINRLDPKHIHFKFDSDNGTECTADDVLRSYMNGKEVVKASRFVESLRKIKSLIHAG
jgi:hypothetical protein